MQWISLAGVSTWISSSTEQEQEIQAYTIDRDNNWRLYNAAMYLRIWIVWLYIMLYIYMLYLYYFYLDLLWAYFPNKCVY